MSNILNHIQENPKETQRLIGLGYEQLQQLIQNAERLHNEKQVDLESKKIRIISGGGGRKPKLSIKEQIILTLVYLRHLTTFQLLGIQFGVSESTANDTFNYWLPILRELLPSSLIEQVKKNESDLMVVKEILTDYELIVDSYEQVRERPGDNEEQEKYFSGKKSNHTFKSQMIVMPDGRDIIDVVAGEPGPKSDITIFREYAREFDPQQRFKGDKAYIGEDLITTPIKKPRNRELTTEQKEQNKEFSANRIFVEHRIRLVKIFRVIQERFRLNPQKYEQVMLTICGLVRFRIRALILPGEISSMSSG
ncbi:IS5/IS1182 family transposase [Mastigocladus laminosus UU774]|nr:IS5/IS1182 family transposase [Mastigocladus laminosus UU774]TFI52269.1 IS5/IS1182 family transposase [Mastigocladus laminosus UU774]TFI52897.1 IS5/IS1182 family transposase [Mastigocladus laminosus UU774]TFI52902.1 IS5/IS1182 family transposase [Mastigocladus laminosus UU774]TFI53240.1 IS5/IS1182 family transposase [Mastigocladus laminosus UU774]